MNLVRKDLILVILLFGSVLCYGQQTHTHGVFWLQLVLSDTITKKIKWEVYLQQRTQNTASEKGNIFASNQLKTAWLWLGYSLSGNSKISLTPFGYFESYVLNVKPGDVNTPPVKEFRWAAKFEYEKKARIVNYSNRYMLEYRLRDLQNNNHYRPNWRARYMVRLEKPVTGILSRIKPLNFVLSDEVFLQFGKAVKSNANVFDQNRLYAGLNYEIVRNIRTGLGYIYGYQERNSGKEFDNINTLFLNFTFSNLFSQFRKHGANDLK